MRGDSLVKVPWVRAVALRRAWPMTLEITVSEHEPLARWNDSALVNVQGETFSADYDGELPQFSGPGRQRRRRRGAFPRIRCRC